MLLIDEIDKADIEFPNDLLQELDKMEFHVYETGETIRARHRPIVIITSNNEKELPDAFLRRCFFPLHPLSPTWTRCASIVEVHHPGLKDALLTTALTQFYEIREQTGLKKKPSTSEVLDWLKLILAEDLNAEDLRRGGTDALPKLHGALLKNEQDVHLFERLAFMAPQSAADLTAFGAVKSASAFCSRLPPGTRDRAVDRVFHSGYSACMSKQR